MLGLAAAAIVLPTLGETFELGRRFWPGYSVARDGPNLLDLAMQTPERRFRLSYTWLDPEGESLPIDPAWLRLSSSYTDGVTISGLPDPPPGAIGWRVYAHDGDGAPWLLAAGDAMTLNTVRAMQRMHDGVFV